MYAIFSAKRVRRHHGMKTTSKVLCSAILASTIPGSRARFRAGDDLAPCAAIAEFGAYGLAGGIQHAKCNRFACLYGTELKTRVSDFNLVCGDSSCSDKDWLTCRGERSSFLLLFKLLSTR